METILTLIGVAILQSPLIIKGSENHSVDTNKIFIYRRWISVLLMIPVIFISPVKINMELSTISWMVLLFNLNVILNILYAASKRSDFNPEPFLQVNLHMQSFSSHLMNALSWMVYLVFYELLVRIILVNELGAFGLSATASTIIALGFYVVLHLPQGLKMTLASIPFGILAVIWISLTGSLLPVIILHLACSLGNDYIIGMTPKNVNHEGISHRLFRVSGK